jgi:hypothetical protein
MQVDSAVELGRDDPALELPWAAEDGSVHYCDIRKNPALVDTLPEAQRYEEMREFLIRVNAAGFPLQTAKSDVWTTTEISPEEEIFSAEWKFASYVDLLFSDETPCFSLTTHEQLVTKLFSLLQRAPEMPASIEFVLRHCHYHGSGGSDSKTGFCVTSYVSGFGDEEEEARQRWAIALKLLQHALVQAVSM